MALSPGAKLGPYEIIAPLGAGGMGEVYRARDPQLGRDVAIKVLPAFLSRDPDRLRRFEQEARAAAALNHPNILAVYQLGTHEGAPYLVSELLEGSTLRDQLLRGPLAIRKAVDYGTQVARGLAAAHEKGIVHRDLKPENLFLTKDGRIKILDFGLAKLIQVQHESGPATPTLSEGTEPGVVLGTVGYMSPEQVRGHAADSRADLFALGAILYEMLAGKRAFHKPTSAETNSAILNEEPPAISQIIPSVPPALQRVVHRCLEKSPEQRFHSASDLAFALEALSDSGSAPSSAFAAAKSRTSWTWILAAGIAVAIIVAFGVWFTRPPAIPVVESVAQLTDDRKAKTGGLESDGARIYFNEGPTGSIRIAQVSINGGQTADVATDLADTQIAGLTGNGSALLVLTGASTPLRQNMWLVPLPAGEARHLSDTDVIGAALFPDGRLVYGLDSGIFLAEKDDSNPRKLEELSKRNPWYVAAATKELVFAANETNSNVWAIYNAAPDGTRIQQLLQGGPGLPAEICCPRPTPDGAYLLFSGKTEGRWDLWTFPREKKFLGSHPAPARLTNGPVSYSSFNISRDGKQVFAVGEQRRGELVRYDPQAHAFLPYLGGISAYDPTYSHDGKWVVYVSYPEHTLWRSRADGSDRLQLTYPPVVVVYPRISPDGSQVAFADRNGTIYVVSINGGNARKVADDGLAASWSPDGNKLTTGDTASRSFELRIVDVHSGTVSLVPASKGMIGAWFLSRDSLVAISIDQSRFATFDFKTGKWSDLIAHPDKFVNWEVSPDGRYFFYQTGGNDSKIFRMRMADRVVEEVASLKNFRAVDDPYEGNTQLSVAPDNSALLTRDIGTQEIYAISVRWP